MPCSDNCNKPLTGGSEKSEHFGDIEERIDISIGLIYPLPSNIVAFLKVARNSIGKNCDNPGGDCEFG